MIGLSKRRKTKLPFLFGTNSSRVTFPLGAADTTALNAQVAAGMVIDRNEVPWNFTKAGSSFTGLESAPGVYNEPNISAVAAVAATLKAAGQTPLFMISSNQSPALCAMLTTALASGTNGVTTIGVSKLPFAIGVGDSVVITDPANQAHTQTVTAQSAIAKGASGTLTVTSFNVANNYPGFVASTTNPPVLGTAGAWIYDTSWPACTPQHLADLMVHLVSNAGLKGCHWELGNEPDGVTWGTDAMLVAQAHKLCYAAMKAADPTCVVHGIVIENMAPIGFPEGTAYYELCVQAGILGSFDFLSIHQYSNNPNGQLDYQPDLPDTWGKPYWKMLADFQKIRSGLGDTTPIWITEFGWTSGFRSTVAAGSNGIDVATLTGGASTLSVASAVNWAASGFVYVQTANGTAKCSYTSTGTGVLNGAQYLSGDTGAMATGGTVTGGIGLMNWQLQAQYFSDLLTVLAGYDPINHVLFSSYLKAMVQFQFASTFQEWRIFDTTNGAKPAYTTISNLIAGR